MSNELVIPTFDPASHDTQTGKAKSQKQIIADQYDRLREIGGEHLSQEDDITFSGTKFVIPQRLSLSEAIVFLKQRAQDEEATVSFSRSFKYRPWDGARATANAIRAIFGYTMGKPIQSFFGTQPPEMRNIQTDVDQFESVPWGAMYLPGLRDAVLYLGADQDRELGLVFAVNVECLRKDRALVEGLFKVIEAELVRDSIYKGKAINGAPEPGFIDTSTVSFDDVVYTQSAMAQLEANVWSPIRHALQLADLGMPGKRSVLLEGPYGTGKSLAAYLTAKIARENGWTFLMCRPGVDKPAEVLQTARMYQPAVVFIEDVDTFAQPGSNEDAVSKVLDMFDGVQTKGLKMVLVMTTNHKEKIHKGMLRPGRLDSVIHIGAMDEPGVEKLARRIIGDKLEDDIDFHQVFRAMDGFMPAFVREAFDRAVRYSVSLNDGVLGRISTAALVQSAEGLREQLDLMNAASDKPRNSGLVGELEQLVSGVVADGIREQVVGLSIVKRDGNTFGTLAD